MASYDLSRVRYDLNALLPNGDKVYLNQVIESMQWEENEQEIAQRLNLKLRDVSYGEKRLSELLPLCTWVYLFADWGEGFQEVFRGQIWEWEHSHQRDDSISVTCYDPMYYMQKSHDNFYWKKKTKTRTMIDEIMKKWNIPLGEYSGPDVVHKEAVLLKNKTIIEAIEEILKDAYDNYEAKKTKIRSREGLIDVYEWGTGEPIWYFSADTNITSSKDKYSMTELVTRIIIEGKEDKKNVSTVNAVVNGDTSYGIIQELQTQGNSALWEAKNKAEKTLEEKGNPKRTIKFESPDFPPIRKGTLIFVKLDTLGDFYIVNQVSHVATDSKMSMQCEPLHPPEVKYAHFKTLKEADDAIARGDASNS